MNPLARKAAQAGAKLVPGIARRIVHRRAAKGKRFARWLIETFGEPEARDMKELAREYVEELDEKRGRR